MAVVAIQGGGIHEHGEWEATSGGQTKILKFIGIRGS
jgi:hypothetical protein